MTPVQLVTRFNYPLGAVLAALAGFWVWVYRLVFA